MEISEELRAQLTEDRRCVVNEVEQIENQLYGEASSGVALAKMSPRRVQRYRMAFVPQAKASEWGNSGFSFLRVKGQSVSIRPDGRVQIQKVKETPNHNTGLDSTALTLESEESCLDDEEYDSSLALQLGDSLGSEQELFLAGTDPPTRSSAYSDEEILAADGGLEESIEINNSFGIAEEETPNLSVSGGDASHRTKTRLTEAIDVQEKKLWDEAITKMGSVIKLILQELNESRQSETDTENKI